MAPKPSRLIRFTIFVVCTTCLGHTHGSVGVVDPDTLLPPSANGFQQPLPSVQDAPNGTASPWSHDPVCARSTALATMGKKYCVYTSNMTGPVGMSLFVPASAAAEAAAVLDDNPLTNFLTASQAQDLYSGTPPYKVVPIPGKGLGVVTTRDISQFETIMVDQASVFVATGVEKQVGKKTARELLWSAVEQLRVPGEVRGMSGEHGARSEGDAKEGEKGKLEEDVMLTNAYGARIGETQGRALFPLISVGAIPTVFSLANFLFCFGCVSACCVATTLFFGPISQVSHFPHRSPSSIPWPLTCSPN